MTVFFCLLLNIDKAMQTINLTLSITEARLIVAALWFVRSNLAFNADKCQWQFVPGKSISYDIAQVIAIEDLKAAISDSIESAIETHPFNPYVKTF